LNEEGYKMSKDQTPQYKIDITLILVLLLLAIVSIFTINSAEDQIPEKLQHVNFAKKQVVWYILATAAIFGTMLIDFDRFKYITWYLYGFGMLLLLGLEFNFPSSLVQTINGATGWYKLGPLGNFQPAELEKLVLILLLSRTIVEHHDKYPERTKKDDLRLIAKFFIIVVPPMLLILKQPDLGSGMVITAIVAAIMFVSGIRFRYIFALASGVIAIGALMVFIYLNYTEFFKANILDEYQLNRFYGWLAPYEYETQGYQLRQALLAIGSGTLMGKGYSANEVYFPEPQTDFIFAIFSENFGFVGSSIVISLFFLLIYRMIHIALESNDPFGSYICAGVIGMITFQVFQNIGMTVGLLPITGIPLPFISYGGSSLLIYMVCIGLVLNVRSRTRKYMFD
jgi:rod shape-determining protein RodA